MTRPTKGKTRIVLSATAATSALALAGVLGLNTPARAADDAAGVALFEAKIRPVLAQSCVGCHGAEKQKGKLRLDTREMLLKGGMDEDKVIKVVEPGDPAKSMIIEAIEYKNEDIAMPPPKKNKETGKTEPRKLPDETIAAFKEWVKLGAPYGAAPVEAAKK